MTQALGDLYISCANSSMSTTISGNVGICWHPHGKCIDEDEVKVNEKALKNKGKKVAHSGHSDKVQNFLGDFLEGLTP